MKKSPAPWFWYGNSTFVVWIIDTFLTRNTWDWILGRMFNLKALGTGATRIPC
ncbi:hypothetical protein F4808DRAFT_425298 [Astrocystis sublimbata]|nr:hypothetical protein F4808DRAFT_425298 [Astrocystis sublimbata]